MPPAASLGNLLIIDDDRAITDLLQLNFRSEGYNVRVKELTTDVTLRDLDNVHLVLVDAARQTPSGIDFIKNLKSSTPGDRIAVIFFSAHNFERTLIEALDAGADDAISKPFSLREMLARVRAVMRRRCRITAAPAPADVFTVDNMRIDLSRKAVTIDAEFVNLSNTEFAILEKLVRNSGTYTSRMEIFRSVWPDGTGANERIVDTNISRIRRKLGQHGALITNRSGLGYMISL